LNRRPIGGQMGLVVGVCRSIGAARRADPGMDSRDSGLLSGHGED
jgi:hypothetical protein